MTLRYSFFLLLVVGQASAKDYVIGGQNVKPTDPIQASTVGIFDPSPDGKSGALCTGSLIRKDMAVTAAHCLSNQGAKPTLIFGPDLHSPSAPRREVDAVAINPKWKTHAGKGMDQGDIALVKFSGGLPKTYKTIPTVSSDKDIKAGSEVTLAGYGISNAQTKTGAGVLRRADVSVLKNRLGKSEMILDQSRGHGACHGDSGGPAFLRQGGKIALAGVTNRGYPSRAPDDCAHKSVYTKLPAYRSWIQKSEKKLEEAPAISGVAKSHRLSSRRTLSKSFRRTSHKRPRTYLRVSRAKGSHHKRR